MAQTILCEVGTDVSRFRNASAFASWLRLCPEKKISGGKVLFTKSRRVRSRVATALRMGAQSLHHAKDYLGEFFRRITRKLGRPQAITATAHKLARIVFHVLSTKEPYSENVFCRSEAETLKRAETRPRLQAARFGLQIISTNNLTGETKERRLQRRGCKRLWSRSDQAYCDAFRSAQLRAASPHMGRAMRYP
jgi:hypothetical protein